MTLRRFRHKTTRAYRETLAPWIRTAYRVALRAAQSELRMLDARISYLDKRIAKLKARWQAATKGDTTAPLPDDKGGK